LQAARNALAEANDRVAGQSEEIASLRASLASLRSALEKRAETAERRAAAAESEAEGNKAKVFTLMSKVQALTDSLARAAAPAPAPAAPASSIAHHSQEKGMSAQLAAEVSTLTGELEKMQQLVEEADLRTRRSEAALERARHAWADEKRSLVAEAERGYRALAEGLTSKAAHVREEMKSLVVQVERERDAARERVAALEAERAHDSQHDPVISALHQQIERLRLEAVKDANDRRVYEERLEAASREIIQAERSRFAELEVQLRREAEETCRNYEQRVRSKLTSAISESRRRPLGDLLGHTVSSGNPGHDNELKFSDEADLASATSRSSATPAGASSHLSSMPLDMAFRRPFKSEGTNAVEDNAAPGTSLLASRFGISDRLHIVSTGAKVEVRAGGPTGVAGTMNPSETVQQHKKASFFPTTTNGMNAAPSTTTSASSASVAAMQANDELRAILVSAFKETEDLVPRGKDAATAPKAAAENAPALPSPSSSLSASEALSMAGPSPARAKPRSVNIRT
jgi:hypothetical protein